MRIKHVTQDPNWRARLESIGYGYYEEDNVPYWIDHYYYSVSPQFADKVYRATSKLWEMCLAAVEHTISKKLYNQFHIPAFMHHHIERSWEEDHPSIYGRFDFAYDRDTDQLKMLEFNADTPTSLFETGIVQWHWKNHYFSEATDQFNSVHEQLISTWQQLKPHLKGKLLHFTCVRESLEDLTNIEYLRDTAIQAGIDTQLIYIDDIGWDGTQFIDLEGNNILSIFKLYPWEWMVHEEFAMNIKNDINEAQWIEPSWKMLLSNKAILPILWKLFPDNEFLLPAYFQPQFNLTNFVKKPLLSREGANVEIYWDNKMIYNTPGEYGEEGYVYQGLAKLHREESGFSVVGSWIIGQEPCGISFRESDMPVTTDRSRFIPHIIE